MYRELLVLKYADLHEKKIEYMPVECWNELIKFADWLDQEDTQSDMCPSSPSRKHRWEKALQSYEICYWCSKRR